VEVADEAVLTFPDGLIGLPGTRYALVEHDSDSPFLWLHSTEHEDVALPVTTPWLFFSDYEVRVPDEDARRLELARPEDADILCVVRASEELSDFTINLAGPVIVHRGRHLGRQIINDVGGYSVRHPLFNEVELSDVQPAATVATA
jgi:flagellar assembly factor FliW